MTPEQKRIAIAEAFGWRWFNKNEINSAALLKFGYWRSADNKQSLDDPPDYLNDLNAMHEAEKALTPEQELDYVEELKGLIMQDAYDHEPRYFKSNLSSGDSIYRCTSSQRADAFLKTIEQL